MPPHQFVYPRVVPVASTAPSPKAPPASQRDLVQASLLRCPPARRV